jgi:hypothetical protein
MLVDKSNVVTFEMFVNMPENVLIGL